MDGGDEEEKREDDRSSGAVELPSLATKSPGCLRLENIDINEDSFGANWRDRQWWMWPVTLSYLVTVMGLVIPWSFTLAMVDGYSVLVKCPLRLPGILLIIVVGDWVLSILTLAATCSTASVVDVLLHADGPYCPPKFCSRYLVSAAMAFMTWFLSLASSLFNLWLLPS